MLLSFLNFLRRQALKKVHQKQKNRGLAGRRKQPFLEELEARYAPAASAFFSLPANFAAHAGGVVDVPVSVAHLNDSAGNLGLSGAEVVLTFDPSVFAVTNSDVSMGPLLTNPPPAGSWNFLADATTAELDISINSSGSASDVTSQTGGILANISFHVIASAPSGSSAIHIVVSPDVSANGQSSAAVDHQNRAVYTLSAAEQVDAVVAIDNTPPTVVLAAPSSAKSHQPTLLSATAVDNTGGSGLAAVQFQYSADGGTTWLNAPTAQNSGLTYNTRLASLADGTYQLRAVATDKAGNSAVAQAYTLTTLASFVGSSPAPHGGLVMDVSGNAYGTTVGGGAYGVGSVFEISAAGVLTTLASFHGADGANPYGTLLLDGAGNLFGTTSNGGPSGCGTVFEVAAGSSALTTLASFNYSNGGGSHGGLVEDANGNLYGTAQSYGAFNSGTIFEVTAGSGVITALASFHGADGAAPYASLIIDAQGNLFGTTTGGGASGNGTVFEYRADAGREVVLASFAGTDGSDPEGPLVMDAAGNLYGTTLVGGANGDGTVFEVAVGSGTITSLAYFDRTHAAMPTGNLILDGQGNLFGDLRLPAAQRTPAPYLK